MWMKVLYQLKGPYFHLKKQVFTNKFLQNINKFSEKKIAAEFHPDCFQHAPPSFSSIVPIVQNFSNINLVHMKFKVSKSSLEHV